MIRPEDAFQYYAYMLLYIDDTLAIHHDAEGELRNLDRYFKMKPNSIGSPDIYLGTKLKKTRLENGVEAWGMSPSKYVQEAVRNVEEQLKKSGKPGLSKRASTLGLIPQASTLFSSLVFLSLVPR